MTSSFTGGFRFENASYPKIIIMIASTQNEALKYSAEEYFIKSTNLPIRSEIRPITANPKDAPKLIIRK